jgi:hypothetical protein
MARFLKGHRPLVPLRKVYVQLKPFESLELRLARI